MAKTPLQALKEITTDKKAKFVIWYCTDKDNRPPFEKFRKNIGSVEYETCESWLLEDNVQEAVKYYMGLIKVKNLLKIYNSQVSRAINGDTRSADWVVKFSESNFFDNTDNEASEFLQQIREEKIEEMNKE
ncbi:hypothetical protein G8T75_12705 [Clostridium botulinum D/C]|uniref:hypothetical protein n=1 Tax=Clostridium botulinum TaxID=1491 RepID=UPI001E381622|nr:hypothetical protein [Clostridium botulinum]MCD3240817.1 hypothetical protein [Clostridium botulinum D/C]